MQIEPKRGDRLLHRLLHARVCYRHLRTTSNRKSKLIGYWCKKNKYAKGKAIEPTKSREINESGRSQRMEYKLSVQSHTFSISLIPQKVTTRWLLHTVSYHIPYGLQRNDWRVFWATTSGEWSTKTALVRCAFFVPCCHITCWPPCVFSHSGGRMGKQDTSRQMT